MPFVLNFRRALSGGETLARCLAGRLSWAQARTRLSWQQAELARAQGHPTFVRTGRALLTFGVVLFRTFGALWWSTFTALLARGSPVLVAARTSGTVKTNRRRRMLNDLLRTDEVMRDLDPARTQ